MERPWTIGSSSVGIGSASSPAGSYQLVNKTPHKAVWRGYPPRVQESLPPISTLSAKVRSASPGHALRRWESDP
jgi:hypothetical protein